MNICVAVVLLSSGPVVNNGMVLKYYKGLVRLITSNIIISFNPLVLRIVINECRLKLF